MIRLKELREERKWSMRDAASFLKKSYTTYVNHEKGYREPNSDDLVHYARAYGVSIDYLVGRTDERNNATGRTAPNVSTNFVTFPVIGEIAAGYEHYADEDWTDGNIDIPETWLKGKPKDSYFVLRVSGDSMYPQFQEGDVVLVLKQSTMDYSGQIGVVMYDDDKATLKRVEYVNGEDWMKLSPINPQYPPMVVRDEKLEHCRVLGIPKILMRNIWK